MRTRPILITILAALALGGRAAAQDKPNAGGILNRYVYGDPGRRDVDTEAPLSVQQAIAGVCSALLQRDPDDPVVWVAR